MPRSGRRRGGIDAGGSACATDGDCNDGVDCTNDRCSSRGTCVYDTDHARCESGTLCSRSDGCVPGQSCVTSDECDDRIYCNGAEVCLAERCAPGAAVDCADTVDCTADVCDEGLNTCEHFPVDSRCDDGMFCTGAETCDATAGCQAGTPPDCSDALACTTEACDETDDACVATVDVDTCLISGACYAQDDTDGGDFCRSCDHAAMSSDWTVTCTGSAGDDTFEDFALGDFGRSRVTFYAAADGTLRTLQRSDVNNDGYPDLVQPNYYTGSTRIQNSFVYLGTATGLDPAMRIDLPTQGGIDSAIADLNHDGYVDIVFCNHHNNSTYNINSYVYWGSATGFDTAMRSDLPTHGCYDVTVADLDRNGWLDIVFGNYRGPSSYNTTSYVYYGDATGFSTTRRTSLPTTGVIGSCLGDLNDDGYIDVAFTGYYNGSNYNHSVYIFWGTATGPDPSTPDRSIPTRGGRGCSIADLNADGYLDMVVGNHYGGTNGFVNSEMYYGSASGLTTAGSTAFGTSWASHPVVADMDGNGTLDVIITNAYNGSSYRTNSQILYRDAAGAVMRVEFFPTIGAYDVLVLDWDGDGYRDLHFNSYRDGTDFTNDGQHFAGTVSGPGTTATAGFPAVGSLGLSGEYGNTYDRSWIERFESRVFDLGAAVESTWLEVVATVPAGTRVEAQVRTAATMTDLATAAWSGPTGTDWYGAFPARLRSGIHAGHQFAQYRLRVEAPNAIAAPVIDVVRIHYR